VNKEVMEIYTDLSAIFSLDSNQIISRELLMKVMHDLNLCSTQVLGHPI